MKPSVYVLSWLASVGLLAHEASAAPAEYRTLHVIYQMAQPPVLTETRTGEILLKGSSQDAAYRMVLVPQRNREGKFRVEELDLVHDGAARRITAPVEARGGYLVWTVPEAQQGDVIRFRVQQSVDLTGRRGGEWWSVNSTVLPLPVQSGNITLTPSAGFAGSICAPGANRSADGYTWAIDGSPASDGAAPFTITSFGTWQRLASWFDRNCAATPGPRVGDLARRIRSAAGDPTGRIDLSIQAVHARVMLRDASRVDLSCRPVETVLESESGTESEVQAVLAALLRSVGVKPERFLIAPAIVSEAPPNPAAFTGTMIRLQVDRGVRWIVTRRLDHGAGGLPLAYATDAALPVGGRNIQWTGALIYAPGSLPETAEVSVVAAGTFSNEGALYMSAQLSAVGPAADWFTPSTAEEGPFASFLKDLPIRSATTRSGSNSLKVGIVANKEPFFLPIERRKRFAVNAIRLARPTAALPDGGMVIGAPGSYREVLRLEIPSSRIVDGEARHVDTAKDFARYRSDAKLENGILVVSRQLDILLAAIPRESVSEAAALWKQIQDDQDNAFLLIRTGPVDWDQVVAAIPPYQWMNEGWRAYSEGREFEGARRIFGRAVETKQPEAWYYLGLSLELLGRTGEAREAFENQIAADPKYEAAYSSLAESYARTGERQKVIDMYRTRLELTPDHVATRMAIIEAYLNSGQPTEAEKMAQGFSVRTPLDRTLKLRVAVARICQGKSSQAELDAAWGTSPAPYEVPAVLEQLLACGIHPESGDNLLTKSLELLAPFIDQRTTDLRSAFAAQFAYARLLDVRGSILLKRGDRAGAIASFRAAVTLAQTPASVRHLAQALWEGGEKNEAVQVWAEAIRNWAIDPGAIPTEAKAMIPAKSSETAREWLELRRGQNLLKDPEPLYYVAWADPDGTVSRLRELSAEPSPPGVLAEVQRLSMPKVIVDGKPVPAVHFIMLARESADQWVFYRSTAENLFYRITALFPERFPVTRAAAEAAAAIRSAEGR